MKRNDSSRLCKELAGLSPWGWDSRIQLHPPGPASKRDFSEVDKLALHHQIDSTQPPATGEGGVRPVERVVSVGCAKNTRRDAPSRLPAKIDDLFGGSGVGKAERRPSPLPRGSGSARKRERERSANSGGCKKIRIKLTVPTEQEKAHKEVRTGDSGKKAKAPTKGAGGKAGAVATARSSPPKSKASPPKQQKSSPPKLKAKSKKVLAERKVNVPKSGAGEVKKAQKSPSPSKRAHASLKGKKTKAEDAGKAKKRVEEKKVAVFEEPPKKETKPPRKFRGLRRFQPKAKVAKPKPMSAMLSSACVLLKAIDKVEGWLY
ncbi:hypothetical protein HOP50_06g42780 [Chloropicon primus]|uniref:Uncharacterized protein n=1 Tax=Chloropicon primus TaxID=1764295 RepID=A0A5B8MQ50_9CHLO|nr:hypothetical protein A3770_06p42530 [Chloropicon primus]UPR00957.1 hypothetical protein HOP50_06g42780 [Chloropicon primus]|eukprot:QDZ21735.1 hypothetical protein A3770_06p42530 [Chloropicon primus]